MLLEVIEVSFSYMAGTPLSQEVLKEINLSLKEGEFVGLVGPTGSGKSTLIQHLNGLFTPTSGKVLIKGKELGNGFPPKEVRQIVGLVFQFPESQLFAETVFDDVAFGPRNFGLGTQEVKERVKQALKMVGLDFETLKGRSPFSLSGGEMRRVAIAGVLAMEPQVLVLDEPLTGLDSQGKREILAHFKKLNKQGLTIFWVSHNMDEIAAVAKRVIVLNQGRIIFSGSPQEVFLQAGILAKIGLKLPQTAALLLSLKKRGFEVNLGSFSLKETKETILKALKKRAKERVKG